MSDLSIKVSPFHVRNEATLEYIAHQMAPSTNRASVWAEPNDTQPVTTGYQKLNRLITPPAISQTGRRLLEASRVNRLQGPFGLDQRLNFLQNNSPWHTYTKVLAMDQAGPVIQASSKTKEAKVVAVKELHGFTMSDFKSLVKPTNEHIVNLQSAFFHESTIYLVYENMEVCLNQVLLTPRGKLPYQEVATICRSVLSGLNYIHKEMGAAHGNVDGSTILLLAKPCQVKIGKQIRGNEIESKRKLTHASKCG
jgi:serine/threonine protein kinase